MNIQLSDHFDFKRLLRFTFPAIMMMVFTSIYGVVDGFFVSNFVGKTTFAAVNFIMPFLMVVGAFGFMFGAGSSALIGKTLGEGKIQKAQNTFSLIVHVTFWCGVVVAIVSIILIKPVAIALGASDNMLSDCLIYGIINLVALPFLMLQFAFTSLVMAAEKPKLGLVITIVAGVTNIIGDALFIAVLDFDVVGAALATAVSQVVGGIVPLVYFSRKNAGLLRLQKPHWDGKAISRTCLNGSSELMSNISMSVIGMLYNSQLMKYAGENGVAAYGTIMYVNFIFLAIFIGYATGIAPVISFHFGAQNHGELKSLLKKSCVVISAAAIVMFVSSELLASPLSHLYVGYDKELCDMTTHAFKLYSFSFLFSGFAIFGSSFFTALNDGITSAIISFLRTLVFQVVAVIVMPLLWGIDGIWYSVVAAELMAVLVTAVFVLCKRKKYGYI